jgi:RNA polymerase sigma-70 factor (ECF subfamily)
LERVLTERNDADLVQRTIAGDREAYAELVRKYASRIYAVCLAILHDPDDSQDVAQDAMLKGMTKIGTLRDGSQFPMWLTRIAQNLCRDHWRTQSRRQEIIREQNVDTSVEAEEPSVDLSSALDKLPEKYRIPLMLYYFDGQSSENVAKALNISRAGASTRIARARRALRQLMEKDHG